MTEVFVDFCGNHRKIGRLIPHLFFTDDAAIATT
jgi:hypothetical protein